MNNEEFSLSNFDNSIITANHHFGIPLVTNDFEFIIHKTHFFESQKESSKFYFIINSKEALINYLKQNTTVEPVNWNAKTIKISFTDPNPTKTRNLLQAIDTLYLEFTKNAKNKAVEQKITFLDTQMGRTSKEIEYYENYFEDFTIEHRTTNLTNDLNNTISLLNAIDSQRYHLRHRLSEIELIQDQIEMGQQEVLLDLPSSINQLFINYNNLMNERMLKLNSYNEKTQVIRSLNQKIAVAEKIAKKRALAYKKNLLNNIEELNKKRSILESNFKQLPSMGTSYNKRRRLYNMHEELYFSIIENKIQLELAKAGTVTNFFLFILWDWT